MNWKNNDEENHHQLENKNDERVNIITDFLDRGREQKTDLASVFEKFWKGLDLNENEKESINTNRIYEDDFYYLISSSIWKVFYPFKSKMRDFVSEEFQDIEGNGKWAKM